MGSVDAITDASGAVQVRLSYSAFGQRRREAGWAGDPAASEWNAIYAITHRGYTFHEMLDDLDIIHMNGRIFDPYAARFASADPFIPDPLDPQSHNRYSYVRNNPLSFIDPSGFSELEDEEQENGGAGAPGIPDPAPGTSEPPGIDVTGERIFGRDLRPGDFGPVSGTAMLIVTGPSEGGTGTTKADKADEVGEVVVRAKKPKRRSRSPRPRMLPVNVTQSQPPNCQKTNGQQNSIGTQQPNLANTMAKGGLVGAGTVGTVGAVTGATVLGSYAVAHGVGAVAALTISEAVFAGFVVGGVSGFAVGAVIGAAAGAAYYFISKETSKNAPNPMSCN